MPTKSGLMVGLGETDEEILAVMRDLRAHDVDMLTIGQYLQPSPHHLPVERYVEPDDVRDVRRTRRSGWASSTPPSARWCARPTTPTSRPTKPASRKRRRSAFHELVELGPVGLADVAPAATVPFLSMRKLVGVMRTLPNSRASSPERVERDREGQRVAGVNCATCAGSSLAHRDRDGFVAARRELAVGVDQLRHFLDAVGRTRWPRS